MGACGVEVQAGMQVAALRLARRTGQSMTSDRDRELIPQLDPLARDVLELTKDLAPETGRAVAPLGQVGVQPLYSRLISLAGSFGSPAPEQLRRLASVVEMLRASSSIHDELIAGGGTRRAGPGRPDSLGAGAAAAAANYLLHAASNLLRQLGDLEPDRQRGLNESITRIVRELYVAGIEQIAGDPRDATAVGARRRRDSRTASLFGLCCGCAAAVAAAPVESLERYGRCLGALYQLLDELDTSPPEAPEKVVAVALELREAALEAIGRLPRTAPHRELEQLVEGAGGAVFAVCRDSEEERGGEH